MLSVFTFSVHENFVSSIEYSDSLSAHDADLERCFEIFSEKGLKTN